MKVEAGPTLKACYGQPWRYVTSLSDGSRSRLSSTCYEEALKVDLWLKYSMQQLLESQLYKLHCISYGIKGGYMLTILNRLHTHNILDHRLHLSQFRHSSQYQ